MLDKNPTCLYKYLFCSTINGNKRGQKPVKGGTDIAGYKAAVPTIIWKNLCLLKLSRVVHRSFICLNFD